MGYFTPGDGLPRKDVQGMFDYKQSRVAQKKVNKIAGNFLKEFPAFSF